MNTLVKQVQISLSTALSQMASNKFIRRTASTVVNPTNCLTISTAIQNLNTAVSNTSLPSGTSTTSVDTSSIATYLSNISFCEASSIAYS